MSHDDYGDYVDALEDDPEEDVDGDLEESCVLNRLRFSNRAIAKLRNHGLSPDDVSFAYSVGTIQTSTSRGGGTMIIARIGKRRVKVAVREIVDPEIRKRADYEVITTYE